MFGFLLLFQLRMAMLLLIQALKTPPCVDFVLLEAPRLICNWEMRVSRTSPYQRKKNLIYWRSATIPKNSPSMLVVVYLVAYTSLVSPHGSAVCKTLPTSTLNVAVVPSSGA